MGTGNFLFADGHAKAEVSPSINSGYLGENDVTNQWIPTDVYPQQSGTSSPPRAWEYHWYPDVYP